MSGSAARLYEEDFVRWTEQQAAALREAASAVATNLPLDWENLAGEIDDLGRSLRRELRSRIRVIIEHLIKLECSPAIDPRRGWIETVNRERSEIEILLDDAPSLKGEIGEMIATQTVRAIRDMRRALGRRGEALPEVLAKMSAADFAENQVLGDWFPGDAPPPAGGGERV